MRTNETCRHGTVEERSFVLRSPFTKVNEATRLIRSQGGCLKTASFRRSALDRVALLEPRTTVTREKAHGVCLDRTSLAQERAHGAHPLALSDRSRAGVSNKSVLRIHVDAFSRIQGVEYEVHVVRHSARANTHRRQISRCCGVREPRGFRPDELPREPHVLWWHPSLQERMIVN